MTKSLCRVLVATGILFAGLGYACAQTGGSYSFAEVKALIEAGQYDEARKLVSSGAGEYSEVSKAFTEAMILKSQGQLAGIC